VLCCVLCCAVLCCAVSTDVLAALPAQHLTRLTVNHLWPQAISQPVLDELLTLTHLQDLTLGFAAGVSSRDAFEAIAKLTRPQDIPKLPQDIDSSVSTASPSFAALTALTCLQVYMSLGVVSGHV
jgi:hypothetical protein